MNYWFIRLGASNTPADKNLHRILAEKHNLVTIGYGIRDDITHLNNHKEIKNKLKTNGRVAGLVNSFVNGIQKGDTIISPIDNGQLKIGKVISDCGPVKSFYNTKTGLEDLVNKKTADTNDPPAIKPAIEVDWIAEVSKDEFPPVLQNELLKSMPATVNKLKISDFTAPEILAMVKYAEDKKGEAKELVEKAKDEHFASQINSAASRTGIYAAIISTIISVLASKFINGKFMHVPAGKLGALLVLILVAIILWNIVFSSKEWKAVWYKVRPMVKKVFNNFVINTIVLILVFIMTAIIFWL